MEHSAVLLLVFSCIIWGCFADHIPHYFDQYVDHFSTSVQTFKQRYYIEDAHFGGPGSPIFMIMGGEGAIPPSVGLYYPFVYQNLATEFKALTIELEHRYYGESLPFGNATFSDENLRLLSIPQALEDAAHFIMEIRKKYSCSVTPDSPTYCPVVTFGGSYPGILSALMRIRYPGVVQIAYAASAPISFLSQEVYQYDYYQVVTESAERSSAGCANVVRNTIKQVFSDNTVDNIIKQLNICTPIPSYLTGNDSLFISELIQIIAVQFANLNMQNYPPDNTTGLFAACSVLQNNEMWQGLTLFLAQITNTTGCFDIATQIPSGKHGTVACGDFSGCGSGRDGEMWDYETCSFEVESIGTNGVTDMFNERPFSLDWLNSHCMNRFSVVPQPNALAELYGLYDLVAAGASKIIFTNGLNDGWSVGGIQQNLSDTLIAINMPNGAHHSDLSHSPPSPRDTPDVIAARAEAATLIRKWLTNTDV